MACKSLNQLQDRESEIGLVNLLVYNEVRGGRGSAGGWHRERKNLHLPPFRGMSASLRRCAAVLVVALLSVSIVIFAVTRSSAGRTTAILRVDHAGLLSGHAGHGAADEDGGRRGVGGGVEGLLEYMLPAAIFGEKMEEQEQVRRRVTRQGRGEGGEVGWFLVRCGSTATRGGTCSVTPAAGRGVVRRGPGRRCVLRVPPLPNRALHVLPRVITPLPLS